MYVEGSDATITSTLVRDTRENEFARGIGIEATRAPFNERANVTIRESVVSDTPEHGVFVNGAEAVIEASAIRDILPTSSQIWGRGIHVQEFLDSALPARIEVRHSVIERCFEAGLFVTGADAQVASTLVRGVEAAPANDIYGDGIAVVLGNIFPAAMTVDASRIEGCARAGLGSFGAITTMGNTVLECNAIHLAGEILSGVPASYQDMGGNVCGCAGDHMPCKVLSSNLAPPAASP